MTFDVNRAVPFDELSQERIEQLFTAAAEVEDIPADFHYSVAFVSDAEIQPMNKEYRGKDYPTDVLSFRYSDTEGEIIISADRIRAQAKEFGHSAEVEGAFMLVHGILHVMGWDHERSDEEARDMRQLEHSILRTCSLAFAR